MPILDIEFINEAYADLKDKEKTLEYLNKAYQHREPEFGEFEKTAEV